MLYELRHYIAKDGRETDLSDRFRLYVLPIMRRHGLRVHDFWEAADGGGQLWYVMAWHDEAEMTRLWATFRSDADWLAARAETENDAGIPIESATSVLMRRAPYFDPSAWRDAAG